MTRSAGTASAPSSSFVDYRQQDGIAYITLNRPEVQNAVNTEMRRQLVASLEAFDLDDGVGVAILSGNGKSFCAGADVKERFYKVDRKELTRRTLESRPTGFLGQTVNWKPVIAAVQGYVIGNGCHMAFQSDLLVACEDAKFGLTEGRYGIASPGLWAEMQTFMPSKVALEMMLFSDTVIGANELHRLGMINYVVKAGENVRTAEALARRLLKLPQAAIRANCRLTRFRWSQLTAEAMLYTAALGLRWSTDFMDGARDFTEKAPGWAKPRARG